MRRDSSPLYLVYIDHRNIGFTPWSVRDNKEDAFKDLRDCADYWEASTTERFGSCDREDGDTWVGLGDTGTVCVVNLPGVNEVWK